ncbi:AlbA family DNA-binding domain-containing protein [Endozoicomonas acroporae]|uniref:AlbA family DNA-binding domain-containing protein n=1 Tax=Endozoicomonas acroporae TaxID=1701104 RepID=UPI000C774151|nr:ATP-binding protein [Endozoicomonas acroporae]
MSLLAGFINSDGGILLIGVSDDGTISGLDDEIKKFHKDSDDKLLLHFKNITASRIGEAFYPCFNSKLIKVKDKKILAVHCLKSDKPCFVDNEQFFVRTNPATDNLTGRKMYDYIETHFKNS